MPSDPGGVANRLVRPLGEVCWQLFVSFWIDTLGCGRQTLSAVVRDSGWLATFAQLAPGVELAGYPSDAYYP